MSAAAGRIAAFNDQTKGILCMIAGVLVLTTQDAVTKWLTAGFHAGEIMFYRGLFSFIPIAVLLWREGGMAGIRSKRPALNLLRALLDYKSGKRKNPIMQSQVENLAKQDLADLAAYFAGQASPLFSKR